MPLHVSSSTVLIIRRSKLYYTASDIITPVCGCPVHRLREDLISYQDYTEMHVQQNIKITGLCYFLNVSCLICCILCYFRTSISI